MSDSEYLLNVIRSRCVEEGDCLIWPGALSAGYSPCVTYKGKNHNLRRWLWTHLGNELPGPGLAVVTKCQDKRCLADHHLVGGRRGAKVGSRRSAAHAAKMAAIQQAKSTLTHDDIAEIRISTKKLDELCAEYQKSKRTIQNIRRGETWRVTTGPFAGLGARTASPSTQGAPA